eukprot:TRINITY_DN47218_c1_g1_i1.p1 TRINITY_DN47218_c1_g1~~TRINITY_DN47218_c1_g1_i1.p1  ORF type:complete len:329 (+),score=82.63 TRINITY_DN47218_c1_g1_i1:495-1481(+)
MPSLIEKLEDWIIGKLLNESTAAFVLIEGIRVRNREIILQFDSVRLVEEADKLVVENLEQIIESEASKDALTNLPFEKFKALCQRDDIKVERETTVLNLVKSYILKRDSLPVEEEKKQETEARNREEEEEKPKGEVKKEEEKPKEEVKKEEEKKEEVEKEEEKKEEEKVKKEEEKKEEERKKAKKRKRKRKKSKKKRKRRKNQKRKRKKKRKRNQPLLRKLPCTQQHNLPLSLTYPMQSLKFIATLWKNSSKVPIWLTLNRLRRLTDEEKVELLKCVRYSYLEHKELLTIFNEPVFALAKDFVILCLFEAQIDIARTFNKTESIRNSL